MHYGTMIKRFILICAVTATLGACTGKSNVDVTSGSTASIQTRSRAEPIFYNGQNYKVSYAYNKTLNLFDMRVQGTSVTMTAKDANTATAIATSALRHFACPDSLSGHLIGQPKFVSTTWSMQAKCA